MKKIVLAATLVLGSASLMATEKYSYEISPIIGYNIAEGNINVDDYVMYGAELQFNNLFDSEIKPELSVLYGNADYNEALDGKDTDVLRIGLNGVYEFAATEHVVPFMKAGMGYENFSDNYNSGNHNSVYVDAGVGAKFPVTEQFALKLEAIYFAKNNKARWDNNLGIFAGLTYAFWENETESAVVVVDSDGDGVADDMDKCPSTVAGAKVDAQGCELDSDNDGVVDSKDQCPLSAAGAKVDAQGCELDSDNDGVVDSLDQCPNTLEGIKVDANGCAVDSDGDGVTDDKDKCANTPAGSKVDENGCMETVNLFITFKTGSYEVDDASMENIKKFAAFMKAAPMYNVTIIGYTDSVGSAASNQRLSQKRAEKVRELIIAEGVEANRVKALGKGEADPIASNATAEGRAKNRRIEAHLEK